MSDKSANDGVIERSSILSDYTDDNIMRQGKKIPTAAVGMLCLITLTTGLGGLLLYRVEGWPGALLVLLMVACMLAVIAILETAARSATPQNSISRTEEPAKH